MKSNNVKISVRDWIFDILAMWRAGIVLVVLFAILLGAFSYYKSDKKIKADLANEEKISEGIKEEKDYPQLLKNVGLNAEKTERAEKAAASIYGFEIAYVTQKEYMDNSIWLSLDSASVPTVELKYYVDNHYQAEYPVVEKSNNAYAIAGSICDSVYNEEVYQKIAAELGDEENRYYDELIRATMDGNTSESSSFTIAIVNTTKERALVMADVIKDCLNQKAKMLAGTMGDFDLVLTGDTYRESVFISLLNDQRNGANSLIAIRNNIYDLIDKLDDDVAKYALLKVEELEASNPLFEDEEVQEEVTELLETEKVIAKPHVSKKYVLLGMILGAFLLAAFVICRNLFNTKLYSGDELVANFDVTLLGVVETKKKKKKFCHFIDDLIEKLRNGGMKMVEEPEALQLIAAKINLYSEKNELSNIAIISSVGNERCERYAKQIVDNLKNQEINLTYCGNSLYDMKTLNHLTEKDGVVVIEQMNVSSYAEIEREMEVCHVNSIPLVGAVVIK